MPLGSARVYGDGRDLTIVTWGNGLFLSLKKRDGETAVQTLVVPPGEYQPGKRLHMSVAQSSQRIASDTVRRGHLALTP